MILTRTPYPNLLLPSPMLSLKRLPVTMRFGVNNVKDQNVIRSGNLLQKGAWFMVGKCLWFFAPYASPSARMEAAQVLTSFPAFLALAISLSSSGAGVYVGHKIGFPSVGAGIGYFGGKLVAGKMALQVASQAKRILDVSTNEHITFYHGSKHIQRLDLTEEDGKN